MSEERDSQSTDWSVATWEGSRRLQLLHWSRLTLRQKLEALEEMNELAEHFAELRRSGKLRQGSGDVDTQEGAG